MSKVIPVKGVASNKTIKEINISEDSNITILEILRANKIPVSSSCDGEGVCKKCIINGQIVSCQLTCRDFIKQFDVIIIDYL